MSLKVKYDRNGYAEIVGEGASSARPPGQRRRRRYTGVGAGVVQKIVAPKIGSTVPFVKVTAVMGLILDKGLSTGAFTDPIPTKFRVVVYQLMQNRALIGEGTKFWQKDTDFVEDTERQAREKAEQYIAKQGWKLAAISDYTSKPV